MNQIGKETYWSQYANEFEEKQSRVVGREILSLMQEELLKESNLGEVLELGCGTGLFTVALQKISRNVVATDFSDEMVECAKQKRSNLQDIKFQKANAMNLNFEDESFDSVFMANLIHVIGDAERVIRESKRVLKKSGRLIITSFAINEMGFLDRLAMVFRYIKTFDKPSDDATKEKTTKKGIEKLLVDNGFEISKSIVLGQKSKAFYICSTKYKNYH